MSRLLNSGIIQVYICMHFLYSKLMQSLIHIFSSQMVWESMVQHKWRDNNSIEMPI